MIQAVIKGIPLTLETDPAVFSPGGVDAGTLAMLSTVEFSPQDTVLDLGCGCGVVGILAAKLIGVEQVVLCDIQPEAVGLAKRNAAANGVEALPILQSDGLDNVPGTGFSLILSNPPYHADFAVPKRFIAQSWQKLAQGGKLIMVTKRLDWYQNRLTAVFGGVRVAEIDGYYVFTAEKRETKKPAKKEKPALSKKLQRKYNREKH